MRDGNNNNNINDDDPSMSLLKGASETSHLIWVGSGESPASKSRLDGPVSVCKLSRSIPPGHPHTASSQDSEVSAESTR